MEPGKMMNLRYQKSHQTGFSQRDYFFCSFWDFIICPEDIERHRWLEAYSFHECKTLLRNFKQH